MLYSTEYRRRDVPLVPGLDLERFPRSLSWEVKETKANLLNNDRFSKRNDDRATHPGPSQSSYPRRHQA